MVTKYHGFVILDRVLHWQLEIQSVAFPASNFPFLSDTVDISGNFRLGSAFGYCLVLKLTLFHNHDEWRRTCLVTALSKIILRATSVLDAEQSFGGGSGPPFTFTMIHSR